MTASAMILTPITAPQPLTCFLCVGIGLPPDGIATGEECIEIDVNGKIDFACMDCIARMGMEIENTL